MGIKAGSDNGLDLGRDLKPSRKGNSHASLSFRGRQRRVWSLSPDAALGWQAEARGLTLRVACHRLLGPRVRDLGQPRAELTRG